MKIPPYSKEEIEQEWKKLNSIVNMPPEKYYVAENMVIIQKCFGDRAYADALTSFTTRYCNGSFS